MRKFETKHEATLWEWTFGRRVEMGANSTDAIKYADETIAAYKERSADLPLNHREITKVKQ